jgi:aquaporin Z
MRRALGEHWPEYAAEALGLGLFMLSACLFGTLLFHPGSAVAGWLPEGLGRRLLMGLAMGATAVALIYWPPGRRSGAHLNPATTLTFWRLGKVAGADAAWYTLAQGVGGLAGVLVATAAIGRALADPSVNYVATVPGMSGRIAAFVAEVLIAGVLMTAVLTVSNNARLAPYTGLCAGALVAAYITLESPVSGMSMNPARSLASAVPAGTWDVLWIYVVAPPLGMLAAAEIHVRRHGLSRVFCAKLHHGGGRRCIFRCRFSELHAATTTTPAAAVARPPAQEATR